MNKFNLIRSLTAIMGLCVSTSSLLADIAYTAQERSVSVRATFNHSSAAATGFEEFNEQLHIDGERDSWANAYQYSVLGPTGIHAQGNCQGAGGYQAASGEGSSSFDVTFTVDSATPYMLYGYYQGRYSMDVGVEFIGPSGIIYSSHGSASTTADDYYLEGVLDPGVYRLTTFGRAGFVGYGVETAEYALTLLAQDHPGACDGTWRWSDEYAQPDGPVSALTWWDPDGGGPDRAVVVAGGEFAVAGTVAASNIAAWNASMQQWSALGSGTNGRVAAVVSAPNGDLIAGGYFTAAGGAAANHIASWNGNAWSSLGSGVAGPVLALAAQPNGHIVAGGTSGVASWDGAGWTELGPGQLNGNVFALAALPDGRVVAGGDFYFIDANENITFGVASWDGTNWIPIADGGSTVTFALALMPNGDVASGDLNGVVRLWNGTSWTTVPGNAFAPIMVLALAVSPGGEIFAAGTIAAYGDPTRYPVSRWDGSHWTSLNWMNADTGALLALPEGGVLAGGAFTIAHNTTTEVRSDYLARWDGQKWETPAVAAGVNGEVYAVASLPHDPEGAIVAGGLFTVAGGVDVSNIVIRRGAESSALGAGINGPVYAVLVMPDGDVIAGGRFTMAGTVPANSIARWNGTDWSPIGTGMNGGVYSLAALPNGDLVAGGAFSTAGDVPIGHAIARWNGSQWSGLGSGMDDSGVLALAVMPNGDLVAGGTFTTAGGVPIGRGVARWDGQQWWGLGSGVGGHSGAYVSALAVLPTGELVVGGSFTSAGEVPANSVARWDGMAWSPLGSGFGSYSDIPVVMALTPLSTGEVMAGGSFRLAGGAFAPYLARWDGSSWTGAHPPINGVIRALTTLPDGDISLGGAFTGAGNSKFDNIARYSPEASAPVILEQPVAASACHSGVAAFSTLVLGTGLLQYTWQVELSPVGSEEWTPLTDGALPLSTGSRATARGATTDTLTLSNVDINAALRYRAVSASDCGSVMTDAALLRVCAGDFNCDGGADGADVQAFFSAWELGDVGADVNSDGGIDGTDVQSFFDAWEAGGC